MAEVTTDLQKTIVDLVEDATSRTFTFLLIGPTGTGKSSTINTLLGEPIAPVGDNKAVTRSVAAYHREIYGVKFKVVDTPGLCDDLPEAGRDEAYMQMIQSEVSEIDCLFLVKKLDDTRVTGDDLRTIQLISEVLGNQIWHHAIIVFTRADKVGEAELNEKLKDMTDEVRKGIRKASPEGTRYRTIASTAISNNPAELDSPLGERRLRELYMTVFNSISRTSLVPFYFATAPRLVTQKEKLKEKPHPQNDEPREIVLDSDAESDIKDRLEEHPRLHPLIKAGAIAVGTAIGGLPGGIISGAIAGAVEFIMGLFSD